MSEADDSEKFWIDLFKNDRLLNFSDGGNMCGFLGKKHSEETRKRMSIAAQNRAWSMSVAAKKRLVARTKARVQTSEEIEKRRSKLIGQKRSPEFCKKASERMLKEARRKAIFQIDVFTGKRVKHPSIRVAAKKVGISHPNISRAAKNPNYTSGGYKWRYADAN